MYDSKLYWTICLFSFCSYWIYLIFTFGYIFGIPIGITSSAIGLKICAVTAGIKKCKWLRKEKKAW